MMQRGSRRCRGTLRGAVVRLTLRVSAGGVIPAAALLFLPPPLRAQLAQNGASRESTTPATRLASGTSWQPDATPMDALHGRLGGWQLMLHGSVFFGYVRETSTKGSARLGSANWLMLGASRAALGGSLALTAMGSMETLTLGSCGYPLLFSAGPLCSTDGVREYQHPHPPLMELAARWEQPVSGRLGLLLYGGLAGEPALGPVSSVHRASAAFDPVSPITDHELNPAHVADGVVTAGLVASRWKLEGSIFNGEPVNGDRFAPSLAPLHSQSARLSYNPAAHWSLQASAGRIHSTVSHYPGAGSTLRMITLSASQNQPLGEGQWATTVGAAHMHDGFLPLSAALFETALSPTMRHTFFARAEYAQRDDPRITIIEHEDGSHDHIANPRRLRVAELSAGYQLRVRMGSAEAGIGGRASLSFVPTQIADIYGRERAPGFALFASLRPAAAQRRSMPAQHEHE